MAEALFVCLANITVKSGLTFFHNASVCCQYWPSPNLTAGFNTKEKYTVTEHIPQNEVYNIFVCFASVLLHCVKNINI